MTSLECEQSPWVFLRLFSGKKYEGPKDLMASQTHVYYMETLHASPPQINTYYKNRKRCFLQGESTNTTVEGDSDLIPLEKVDSQASSCLTITHSVARHILNEMNNSVISC